MRSFIKVAVLFIGLSCSINAQSLFWSSASSAVFGFTSGLTEAYKTRYYLFHEQEYDKKFHLLQYPQYGSAIALGFFIYDYSGKDLGKIAKSGFLSASIFWLVNDVAYNFGRDRNLFYVSDRSGSPIERFSYIGIKLAVLGLAILINILF